MGVAFVLKLDFYLNHTFSVVVINAMPATKNLKFENCGLWSLTTMVY